jgi:hypothetical protein
MDDQDTLSDESMDTLSDENIDDLPEEEDIPEDIHAKDSIADRFRKQHAAVRILMFGAGVLVAVIILLTIAMILTDVGPAKFPYVYLSVGCFSLLVIGLCIVYDLANQVISLRGQQLDSIRQHSEVYNATRSETGADAES